MEKSPRTRIQSGFVALLQGIALTVPGEKLGDRGSNPDFSDQNRASYH